jgi:catechol 2,3-dioxygenase-like lactoylglutathione lyase family enzyme
MSWSIDHAAITAHDIDVSEAFYADVFGMHSTPVVIAPHPDNPIMPDRIAMLFDPRGSSIHLIQTIRNFHATFPGFEHNPTAPHAAVNVADLDAVEARLRRLGWGYMPPRQWGPAGFARLYTQDPSDNLIEICEVTDPAATTAGVETAEWLLDHVSIPALDVRQAATWMHDALGLRVDSATESEALAAFPEHGTGRLGVRITRPDPTLAGPVNPTLQGHFAITVRNFDRVGATLSDRRIPFTLVESDTHSGGRVLYVHDPSMNLVQVRPHV